MKSIILVFALFLTLIFVTTPSSEIKAQTTVEYQALRYCKSKGLVLTCRTDGSGSCRYEECDDNEL